MGRTSRGKPGAPPSKQRICQMPKCDKIAVVGKKYCNFHLAAPEQPIHLTPPPPSEPPPK
jgi:hypothetical protein